jgi:hypothetical protein
MDTARFPQPEGNLSMTIFDIPSIALGFALGMLVTASIIGWWLHASQREAAELDRLASELTPDGWSKP